MPPNVSGANPPLTLEDMLILFLRRFLAPVAASSLVVGGVLFLIFAVMGGIRTADYGLFFFIFLVPAAVSAVGLALVGIPAGYIVARFRLGDRESLWLLVGIGFAAGLILPVILAFALGGSADFSMSAVLSVAGALVAGIWTLLNRDLFRPDNGA